MQQETNIFLFKREDECDSNNSSSSSSFFFFLQENFSYDKHFLFMIFFFFCLINPYFMICIIKLCFQGRVGERWQLYYAFCIIQMNNK